MIKIYTAFDHTLALYHREKCNLETVLDGSNEYIVSRHQVSLPFALRLKFFLQRPSIQAAIVHVFHVGRLLPIKTTANPLRYN
jgi:hypothetical protein